jgi:alanine dehydrogenase
VGNIRRGKPIPPAEPVRISIPREVKDGERRVGLGPVEVKALVRDGHEVRVEASAGDGAGAADNNYRGAGASSVEASGPWPGDLVVKVKEIQPGEEARLREGQTVFGFHHLVGEPEMTRALSLHGITAIAYEMVQDEAGRFPLLAPMSAIAGAMAVDVAARYLERPLAHVLVLGAGNAGLEAARAAMATGARVTVLTRSERSRDAAALALGAGAEVDIATGLAIERHVLQADLVVGAVFVAGAPTPKLLPRALVARMRRGALIVDVSIDAGGVAETSRPTSHGNPVYVEEGVVHYCVANMPAADPRASAAALAAAALPYVRTLAGLGIANAVRDNADLRRGVLLWKGRVCHPGIAAEAGLPYTPLSDQDFP